MNKCRIILPNEEEKMYSFTNYDAQQRLPFIISADLECILEKNCDDDNSKFHAFQKHKVFSIGYYIHCDYNESLCKYQYFRGESGAVEWFVEELLNISQYLIENEYRCNVPMEERTDVEWNLIKKSATSCSICKKPFAPNDNDRDRDHCHYTGKFRGIAHHKCNLNFNKKYILPIMFHNLSGYDAHFIIKELATCLKKSKIFVLPITKEKYISFTLKIPFDDTERYLQLRFVDSYKHLPASLDKLSSLLDNDKKMLLRNQFPNLTDTQFILLTKKGIFPYEYIDSYDKLNETQLPARDQFYSTLNDETVTEENYEHAKAVWKEFNIRNLGDYSDLYMKIDILLLHIVVDNYRKNCIDNYGLDSAYSYTCPGYAWHAMCKTTSIRMELLTDINMLMFFERGIRGGIAQCITRNAQANNKYMKTGYDPDKATTYLMYLDVNNLYGWAMSQPLPYGNFKWVDNVENIDILNINTDSDIGYIFEVDLSYPQHLHDLHSDLPFCPTHEKPPKSNQTKLLTTLYNKKQYVIHYKNLQQCLKHGLKITKVYRVLQFNQSPWMKPWIDLNTAKRQQATNDFDKNLFKLMINSVFGKTMENIRKHVDVKLFDKWEGRHGIEQAIAKPNFHSRTIFSENFAAVQFNKLSIKFDKPVYIGMCILEISKTQMYDFHYEYMLPQYDNKCKLLYMDTDSFIYNIECQDVYEDMKQHLHLFDTSDYCIGNVYDMPRVNKKVPGLMKDECNGDIMLEFVGLRAKMYAYKINEKETKKSKGVKKNIIAKTIDINDYKKCLEEGIEIKRQQIFIRSKKHKVYTIKETKIALSPFDDKRYIEEDGINTKAWGHYDIISNENNNE